MVSEQAQASAGAVQADPVNEVAVGPEFSEAHSAPAWAAPGARTIVIAPHGEPEQVPLPENVNVPLASTAKNLAFARWLGVPL